MSRISQADSRNQLLAAMTSETFDALAGLQRVDLPARTMLFRGSQPIDAVHFVETGWVSLLATLSNGDAAEVGIVGREGLVGLPLLFGADRSPLGGLVQAGGTALRLGSAQFLAAIEASQDLRRLLLLYAQAHQVQVTYTAVCNGRHPIGQRLARWLLISHDRAEADELPMTHEFLSTMLGVRRAGISVAASALQRAGVIRYEHGRITVLDRARLEAASCDCYRSARVEFDRLLALPVQG